MSDSDDEIRLVATNTFATLIKLVPLEMSPNPFSFHFIADNCAL